MSLPLGQVLSMLQDINNGPEQLLQRPSALLALVMVIKSAFIAHKSTIEHHQSVIINFKPYASNGQFRLTWSLIQVIKAMAQALRNAKTIIVDDKSGPKYNLVKGKPLLHLCTRWMRRFMVGLFR